MSDWILRAEGVNFGETIFNTNDLSVTRGASLTLEAFVHVMKSEWRAKNCPNADIVYYGGSQVAFLLKSVSEKTAEDLAEKARVFLGEICTFGAHWPPYWDYSNDETDPPDSVENSLYKKIPTEHLKFIVEIAEVVGSVRAAVNEAMWKTRRRQMAAPNLPIAPGARAASNNVRDRSIERCPIDPAQTLDQSAAKKDSVIWVADKQFRNVKRVEKSSSQSDKVYQIYASKRSADLRTYGRDARRMLYPVQLEKGSVRTLVRNGLFRTHDFPQSFHQIVDTPPSDLPESVRGKLAYLYFDGNGFSGIRAGNDLKAFSQAVESVNRHVLNDLLTAFLPGGNPGSEHETRMFSQGRIFVRSAGATDRHEGQYKKLSLLRLETLLFGGEDFLVVLPAWLGWEYAWNILEWYADAAKKFGGSLSGQAMSHRCGMLICDQKTPVRRARDMAHALCENAKEAYRAKGTPERALAFHIIESHDVPEQTGDAETDIAELRGNVFAGPEGADSQWASEAFRLLQHQGAEIRDAVCQLKDDMPRSRLYSLIDELDSKPDMDFSERLAEYALKGRSALSAEDMERILTAGKSPDIPLRLHLKVLSELWDYVEPFHGEAS